MKCSINVRSIWSNIWFRSSISLFCLDDLSIEESVVLRSPTLFYCCLFSPFKSSIFVNVFRCSDVWYIWIYSCYILLMHQPFYHHIVTFFVICYHFWLFKSVLSDFSYPSSLLVSTCTECLFPALHFEPVVFLKLKWASVCSIELDCISISSSHVPFYWWIQLVNI